MSSQYLAYIVCSVLSFVPAIVFHEVAHGFAAYKLGDPTAKRAGRLSLNPLKHVDPFGTVILPLCMLAMNGPVFGYAKPVPYNPSYFKNPKTGDVVVGLAGPAANLVMAAFAGAIAWALYGQAPALVAQSEAFAYFYLMFLPMFALINLYLLFFNLLPIPPLDGSHALNLAVSALFGPLVGDAAAALAGVLCSLALLGGVVYLYVQTRGGALVIFAALALLLSALKELRLARRAIKV